MNLRDWRKIHKWVSVGIGIFILTWTLSGIVMILPFGAYEPVAPRASGEPDYREVTTSPAAAIAALSQAQGSPVTVTELTLRQIESRFVYAITLADAGPKLIDARTGQSFAIDQPMAERIARDSFRITAPLFQITRLEQHEPSYPAGRLPVYRIVFDDDRAVAYYVSAVDGVAQRSDNWSRARNAIASLHTFEPLTLITRRERLTEALLLVASAAAVVTALTGYYLALPRRRTN